MLHQTVLAWLRLTRVYQKVNHELNSNLRAWELNISQFDVLAHVGAATGMTQQELADRLLVTKGNISQLLDRMEKQGLLLRKQEGRTNSLALTEKGQQLFDQVVPSHEQLIVQKLAPLSSQEAMELLRLLRKLDRSLP